MKKNKPVIRYEPDADILSYELNDLDIDSAVEMGNVIIHVNKKNKPVLVEILEGKDFLSQANKVVDKKALVKVKA